MSRCEICEDKVCEKMVDGKMVPEYCKFHQKLVIKILREASARTKYEKAKRFIFGK